MSSLLQVRHVFVVDCHKVDTISFAHTPKNFHLTRTKWNDQVLSTMVRTVSEFAKAASKIFSVSSFLSNVESNYSCTRMKPDWDLLAERSHPSVLIADVNCQVEVDLCGDHHTGGTYPTILVFAKNKEPELYQGGRGFLDLIKFVDDNLVEKCDTSRSEETCTEKEKRYISKWKGKENEVLNKEVKRLLAIKVEELTYELEKWIRERIRILEQLRDTKTDPVEAEL